MRDMHTPHVEVILLLHTPSVVLCALVPDIKIQMSQTSEVSLAASCLPFLDAVKGTRAVKIKTRYPVLKWIT